MKQSLLRHISYLALLAALASPATAQTEDEYEAFGIIDDNIPLDQLVPEDDTLPPAQTFLSDDQDAEPETASAPNAPAPAAQAAPVPAAAPIGAQDVAQDTAPALPQVASFTPPADWVSHELKGITFAAPSDWKVVEENSDGIMLFGGDMETHSGPSFGVFFDRKTLLDDDEVGIISEAEYLLADGSQYKRVEARTELGGGDVKLSATVFLSPDTNEDDDYTILMMATYNADFKDHKEMLEQILGTVKLPAAVPKALPEALDGLVSYELPKSWIVHKSADGEYASFLTKTSTGYIAVAMAGRVTAEQGMDDDVPAHASAPQAAQIFGQDAMLQTWEGTTGEFLVGRKVVSGLYSYYRLNKCLPDGAPIGVVIAGAPALFDGYDYDEALAGITLSMPEGMEDCAAPATATSQPAPSAEPAQTAEADTSQPQPRPQATPPAASSTTIDVQGVQFALPQGWTATNDSPSDKIFTSPDERFTILAFWWFPDEPLTNSDDIAVKQVVNDHEPSTRITTQLGQRIAILNVTERARADERRFIFTVEGRDMPLDELQAMHDSLIASLRFNGAFGPETARETPRETPPKPVVVPAQTAPTWESYENPRFGTRISYPANLFRPLAAPANNDGRTFEGINGAQEFLVFGQHNIDSLDVRGLIEQDVTWGGYDAVTYEKAGDGWYVLSGYKGPYIFYRKVLVDAQTEMLHVFEITYPTALKGDYDAIVRKMAASFTVDGMDTMPAPAPTPSVAVESNTRRETTRRNRDEYANTKK